MTATSAGAVARKSDRIMDCPARVSIIVAPAFFAACPCVPAMVPMIAIKTHKLNAMRTAGILYPNGSRCAHGLSLATLPICLRPRKLGYDTDVDELRSTIKVESCAGYGGEQRNR